MGLHTTANGVTVACAQEVDALELHKLNYSRIRPAPRYPSQPDHTEKRVMWDLDYGQAIAPSNRLPR